MASKRDSNNSAALKWAIAALSLLAWGGIAFAVEFVRSEYEDKVVDSYDLPGNFSDPAAQRFIAETIRGDVKAALAAATSAPDGVNTVGRKGDTALLYAVERRDQPMVTALINAGANPNGAPGMAPLRLAVREEDLSIARQLLSAGADPNGRLNEEPALDEAALMGNMEATRLLLDAGARVDEPKPLGATAAMTAATTNHWRIVEFLLDHGASYWVSVTNGMTIADLAVDARIRPDSDEGLACARVIARLKAANYPWPPPNAHQVRDLKASGNWPPNTARPADGSGAR